MGISLPWTPGHENPLTQGTKAEEFPNIMLWFTRTSQGLLKLFPLFHCQRIHRTGPKTLNIYLPCPGILALYLLGEVAGLAM